MNFPDPAPSSAAEITTLLGGAERRATRVRGFAPWRPQTATRMLLDQIGSVLEEYRNYLPLTCRQVFYRLVGAHEYDKTETAYARLCETLNRARRAELISMEDIRDDGGASIEPNYWNGPDHFLDSVRQNAEELRLDRTEGQPTTIVLMCEAAGMAPQIARVADYYGLPVLSSGGFDSVTEKHRLASRLTRDGYKHDRNAEVLHIGDHDPSGVHIFSALAEDVENFARRSEIGVRFIRLAVTPAQMVVLNLSTAPPKPGDGRAFAGETCQAEAIPPDMLEHIVREAVEERLDQAAFRTVLAREKQVCRELMARFK